MVEYSSWQSDMKASNIFKRLKSSLNHHHLYEFILRKWFFLHGNTQGLGVPLRTLKINCTNSNKGWVNIPSLCKNHLQNHSVARKTVIVIACDLYAIKQHEDPPKAAPPQIL